MKSLRFSMILVLALSACQSERETPSGDGRSSLDALREPPRSSPEFREAGSDTDFAFLDAAGNGDPAILEQIDDPYVTTRFYGKNALHLAVGGRHAGFILRTIRKFPRLASAQDRYGLTPLMDALDLHADASVVASLLTGRAGLDIVDSKDGWNAFHYGVIANDEAVMTLLMDADPRTRGSPGLTGVRESAVYGATDRFHRTPFQFAVQFNRDHALRAIVSSSVPVEKGVIPQALRLAAEANFPAITELLLPLASSDLSNVPDAEGRTALMLAAPHHDTRIVHQLLRAGASFLLQDRRGNLALHYAVKNSSDANVALLLDAGAPIDAVNADSETAFLVAAADGFTDLADLLIRRKAALNVTDSQGRTPLIRAAMGRHTDTVELLVKSGVTINDCDVNGMNAAMVAVENLNTEIARLLLRQGINVNQRDKRGRYLRDIAVQAGNEAVIRMIDTAQY